MAQKIKIQKKAKKIRIKPIKNRSEKLWYVAYFSHGYLKKLEKCFDKYKDNKFKDVEMWHPTREVVVVRKNKRVLKTEPLFPGYVFFKFDVNTLIWTKIIRHTPIHGFLKDAETNIPIPITQEEVERVERLCGKTEIKDYSHLVGKRVIVVKGPFKDFTGICKQIIKGRNAAKVEIELINSMFKTVELSVELLEVFQ